MSAWVEAVGRVEALEDAALDEALVAELEDRFGHIPSTARPANFYTPTFKTFQSSEIRTCNRSLWPAVSITGSDCKLRCDHCQAKILDAMIAAREPEVLWRVANETIERGGQGLLLTGGSNHRNEVEYGPYYPVIRRIKDQHPGFQIAAHTALMADDGARSMAQAGVDVAMLDVIGAQDTITQVYHLRRDVEDFEAALATLVATGKDSAMKVVPHLVLGLHYGQLLGEWRALEMLRRHQPDAVVLVVVMPFYASVARPFASPDPQAVGRFFMDARSALADIPLLLGCARPPGLAKVAIDAYAVLAGLDGIAHPSDGMLELAARLGRDVRVTPACCSLAVGREVLATPGVHTLALSLEDILAHEQLQPANQPPGAWKGIAVVAGGG